MKRALTLGLVLIATAVSAADLSLATRHDELRALDVAPSRASPSRKVQWAPSGNFQALHTRAVFGSETETASRPYAREEDKTAAGAGIFLSRDTFEGQLNSAPSLHRFTYAHVNPLRYTDQTGRAINLVAGAVGAGIGFLVGFGVSSVVQLARGDEFSWKKSLASGVGGAISGGIGGLTMGASLVAQVGVGAVGGGVVGSTTTRAILGQETTATDLRDDALISAMTFGLGKGIGAAFARSSNGQMTAAIKELEKETVAAAKQAAQQTAAPAVVKQVVEDGAAAADDDVGGFLLRGTTEGYPGSPGLQKLGVTPTTTDPGAAVIFGTEAVTSNGGKGVVLVAPRSRVPIGEANVLAAKELEVAVELAPSEFAKRAQSFELETVRAAVKKAGVEVPKRIYGKEGIDEALGGVPRLTPEQVDDVLKNLGVKK